MNRLNIVRNHKNVVMLFYKIQEQQQQQQIEDKDIFQQFEKKNNVKTLPLEDYYYT